MAGLDLARGGGKSWAARTKAFLLAFNYSGIQILLLRRTLQELRENHILPLQGLLKDVAKYDAQNKEFKFPNGSRMKFGYCAAESDVLQYQGQAYDVIFMEEATQFTEFQKDTLSESNRSSGMMKERFTPRMYFTCNPGGVGHAWVKRLFIDREYRNKERIENYEFIPSTVYENKYLMENNPEYVENLENLPEMRKRAMLYGDWDAFEGQYFSEWDRSIHVIEPFEISPSWNRFISIDYGMDMLAAYWWAVDTQGNCFVYREYCESGLILSAAAEKIIEHTGKDENISYAVASPDLWNKRQETGESGMEVMYRAGLKNIIPANNARIAGWRTMREYLKPTIDMYGNKSARLKFFSNCIMAIKNIPLLQYDDKKIEDAASEPHEITHYPEACLIGDTMVNTCLGDIKIKDLVNKDGYLYCYDENKNEKTIGYFNDVRMTSASEEVFLIKLDDGRNIKATKNHPILTTNGWKFVCELKENDDIIEITL